MSAIEDAEEAVGHTAKILADRLVDDDANGVETRVRADALKVIAESVSAVKFGPQGGGWTGEHDYRYDNTHRYPGTDGADRSPAGFRHG